MHSILVPSSSLQKIWFANEKPVQQPHRKCARLRWQHSAPWINQLWRWIIRRNNWPMPPPHHTISMREKNVRCPRILLILLSRPQKSVHEQIRRLAGNLNNRTAWPPKQQNTYTFNQITDNTYTKKWRFTLRMMSEDENTKMCNRTNAPSL